MKKIWLLLIALSLISLAACSSEEKKVNVPDEPSESIYADEGHENITQVAYSETFEKISASENYINYTQAEYYEDVAQTEKNKSIINVENAGLLSVINNGIVDSFNNGVVDILKSKSFDKIRTIIFELMEFFWKIKNALFGKSILFEDDHAIANKSFEKLLNAIKAQDSAAIVSKFSKTAQRSATSLEADSVKLINFIQGNIVSVSDVSEKGFGSTCKTNHGKQSKEISYFITIYTDEQTYYVRIHECTKDDNNPDNIGIKLVRIINAEDWEPGYGFNKDEYGEWVLGITICK